MAEEVIRLVVNKDAEQPVIDSVVFATDNAGTIDQCKVVPVSEIDSLEEENNSFGNSIKQPFRLLMIWSQKDSTLSRP